MPSRHKDDFSRFTARLADLRAVLTVRQRFGDAVRDAGEDLGATKTKLVDAALVKRIAADPFLLETFQVLVCGDHELRSQLGLSVSQFALRTGVPRDVSDYTSPGPASLVLIGACLDRSGRAAWLSAATEELFAAARPADATLLAARVLPKPLSRLKVSGVGRDLIELASAVRAFASGSSNTQWPATENAREWLDALFLRGLRRHVARRQGLLSRDRDAAASLPGWLVWAGEPPTPIGLAAMALEWWISADALTPDARAAVDDLVATCGDGERGRGLDARMLRRWHGRIAEAETAPDVARSAPSAVLRGMWTPDAKPSRPRRPSGRMPGS